MKKLLIFLFILFGISLTGAGCGLAFTSCDCKNFSMYEKSTTPTSTIYLDEFGEFVNYFTYYQNLFGLSDYQIDFKYENLSGNTDNRKINPVGETGGCGMIVRDFKTKTATVWLNTPENRIKRGCGSLQKIARHEALHLYFAGLDNLLTEDEEEELVIKLTKLIE